MATSSATLSWATSLSSLLKQSQSSSPIRAPLCHHHHHRILPVRPSFALISSFSALASAPSALGLLRFQSLARHPNIQSRSSLPLPQIQSSRQFARTRVVARSASSSSRGAPAMESEEVFFDGGVHYGDLLANLVFGLTLVWLPLTLAAVFRGLFLRYRFTNLRITIQSGLLGDDRKDFSYDVVKDVKLVPRFIGEWGDMAIELKDGTKVDIRCVPKFREIAKYVEERAAGGQKKGSDPSSPSSSLPSGGVTPKKGFS